MSTRLKLGPFEEDGLVRTPSVERQRQQGSDGPESPGSGRPCRVPVRLYVRSVEEGLEDIEDAVPLSDWESVSYINRPFEIRKVEGRSYITLEHALHTLLPGFFSSKPPGRADDSQHVEALDLAPDDSDTTNSSRSSQEVEPALASLREANVAKKTKVKLVRVQGIELDMDIPFLWVANNLKNPEYYLHICVYVGTRKQ
uniref:Autophagy protein 5 n=1 Tax=Arundo donax TaxID=35708 RepID=A0A0A9CER4_ARUDO